MDDIGITRVSHSAIIVHSYAPFPLLRTGPRRDVPGGLTAEDKTAVCLFQLGRVAAWCSVTRKEEADTLPAHVYAVTKRGKGFKLSGPGEKQSTGMPVVGKNETFEGLDFRRLKTQRWLHLTTTCRRMHLPIHLLLATPVLGRNLLPSLDRTAAGQGPSFTAEQGTLS